MSNPLVMTSKSTPGWRELFLATDIRVWLSGYLETADLALEQILRSVLFDCEDAKARLGQLKGQFALVAEGVGCSVAIVDQLRSVPLAYARTKDNWRVDPVAGRLARTLELSEVDPVGALALAMAGYTIGTDTLYRELQSLLPGEWVRFSNNEARRQRYWTYEPWRISTDGVEVQTDQLVEATFATLQNLTQRADGAAIVVPLSAGLDSRLIVSGLRHLGYDNVICFSYGLPGNHEAVAAESIAHKLGYPWHFVPTPHSTMRDFYASALHQEYLRYADTCTACPFEQDLYPLARLIDRGLIADDAIIVNGNSGDYISGGHVPAFASDLVSGASNTSAPEMQIAEFVVKRHFHLWDYLSTRDNHAIIQQRLLTELQQDLHLNAFNGQWHALMERREFFDRQAKYVINGQRTYEFLERRWSLPLWSHQYLDFWEGVPLAQKLRQNLYRSMLIRENWGGVWGDEFSFARTIQPRWLRVPRLLVKALHVPFGKDRWHVTERRMFEWWMTTTAATAVIPYGQALFDSRGARGAVSWHTERYLAGKGLHPEGLA